MGKEMHIVLHGVAVKKHCDAAAVADLVGLDTGTVEAALAKAVEGGRAALVNDRFMLTPAGRMIVEAQYSKYYGAQRADDAFIAAHERFERINTELKQAITDWQTMSVGGRQVANDHSDADYDERIIDRIGAIDEKVEPCLAVFAASVPRFARYRAKLEAALDKAEDGDHAWISDVTIESYHTVWFEMHEDILRVLGREREE